MIIVSTSYVSTPGFNDPVRWLNRISFYTGILEKLAERHTVHSIEQINYTGKLERGKVTYHFFDPEKRQRYVPTTLHHYIKKLQPDVVLVNGLMFPFQVMQLRWTLGSRAKIFLLHRAEKPTAGKRKWLQQKADRYVDAYLFASDEIGKEWVRSGIIRDELKIVEAIDASSSFFPTPRSEKAGDMAIVGHPVFIWVGRLDENKDPVTVVKTFLQFVSREPGATLYMIYQDEFLLSQLQGIVTQSNAPGSVKFIGAVPHTQLQEWYNASDFVFSGSHYEGSGIGVCEAMSCGCIPIVTNIPSFRRMTGPGQCGLLFEPGDQADLLRVLMETKTMNLAKERLRTIQQFRDELSFDAIGRKIENLLCKK
ncbi:MAG: glycosyltransferase family 4 protein [Chitinophagaceae bacterium]|nr:glycosyltransferase family 4 protein [Chitinophagaceae bacterium]